MDMVILEKKIESLLSELKECIENKCLSENERYRVRQELDRILYECMYYKNFVP